MERTDFYREIAANKRRSFLLMFVFALVVLGLGYFLGLLWGNRFLGLLIALFLTVFMMWLSYYESDKIVLSMSGARPVTREEYPHLYHAVEGLAIAAGVPAPRCYVIDDDSPNAFATGRDPEHGVICVTTGLLDRLGRYELEGVVAHEMSHIKNYDIRVQTMAVVLAGVVVLLADLLLYSQWLGGGRRRRGGDGGGGAVLAVLMLVGLLLALLSPLIAQLLKLAISRKREYLADATAVELTRYPDGLADALEDISRTAQPLRAGNKATAHLFIVNPLKGKGMSRLFSTHPPIEERVRRLRAMDFDSEGEAAAG